ncbi:hypothetical protein OPV22_016472 [Ensete ventricosum]|uniref:YTH domain-containing family protein n=1 Tax=Ensete ventricosum TaxID=4639 RepID=A0AAV8QYQ7_ENSVE|nr:hypothetical protein OPV22_016472 [Ensete ventricosum]
MEAKAKPEKPIEDSMRKLKIDPSMKVNSINVSGAQAASQSDSRSCISSGDATSSIKETEVDQEPLMGDQGMYYYGYYYPGSSGILGEWDDRFCVQRTDTLQVQHPGIQADNGSVIYYIPGYQAGYTPYGPLLPGAMYGVDGQFLNQSYCPSPISPQALVSPGPLPQQVAYGPELMPAYPWDPSFFFADEIQGSRFSVDQTKPHYRPNLSSDGHTLAPSSTFPASKSAFGTKGSSPVSDLSHSTMIHNQTQKPVKKAAAAVLSKGYDPVNKFNAYVNQGKGPVYYPNSVINMKENGQSWVDDEKLKVRNKLNSRGDLDLLNEQNRGPRTNGLTMLFKLHKRRRQKRIATVHCFSSFLSMQAFRHIILENNDNKPVTNSRDTQEVKFSQGTELLSSFKSYSSKTSILDDFGFYENRQKAMQDKRNKPTTPPLVNSLPKNVESTEVPKLGDSKSQPPDLVSVEVKEGLQTGIASRK